MICDKFQENGTRNYVNFYLNLVLLNLYKIFPCLFELLVTILYLLLHRLVIFFLPGNNKSEIVSIKPILHYDFTINFVTI